MKPIFAILIIGILCLLSQKCIVKNDNTANSTAVQCKVTNNLNLPKPGGQTDTNELKQSGWYASALKNIEQLEYHIQKKENTNIYSSPNRKNNLRFEYDEYGFTVEPQTTRIPIGAFDAAKRPDEIKYKNIANWKVAFNLDKKQIGEGSWQVNGNRAEYITDNITVQYINNEEGMRQNFIVQKPLTESDSLQLHFSVQTKLKQQFSSDRLQFADKQTGVVLSYEQLKVWDANGRPLEATFTKSSRDYCIQVNTKNAIYPITIDPISTTPATVLGSGLNGYFGTSVSSAGDVNGDGYSDVIVGAYSYYSGSGYEGAAFVYHGSATGISTAYATMLQSNQSGAYWGYAVSGAGDVNGDGYSDVIVGAYLYNNGETREGVALVYHGSATGIKTTAAAMVESNQADARMGYSVSGAGDVNGDGYSDVIVGAYWYDKGETNEGVVFVYHGSATGISTTAAATVECNQASARLGWSVAGAGDINGDGYSDVIVGASRYDSGQFDEGVAFVYRGSATGINTTAAAMVEFNSPDAYMGFSVSSAGDVNGDGYSDVIVGAYYYVNGQSNEGVFFVYHGSATGISTTAAAVVESNKAGAQLGISVSCAGDINGDGYSDVIVGAYYYSNGQSGEGAIYIYHGSAMGINTTPAAIIESDRASANMGVSVASAGDVNGDGYSDVITGANFYNGGRAFIYHGSAAGISNTNATMVESNQATAYMGYSVSGAGDVNSDGYSDVVVSAIYYDNGQTDEGAAFIYHGSATGISTTPAAMVESNQAAAYMGYSVSGAGDVNGDGYSDIIVGAIVYDNGETDEGAAYVFHGSPSGIITTPAAIIESNQASALMGRSVACAGDVNGDGYSDVVVGAFFYDNGQTNEGAAFIYHGSAAGINTTAAAMVEGNQAGANMGYAVSGAGDVNGDGYSDVIVGAFLYDNAQSNEGAAFVYHGSATGINTTAAAMLVSNQADASFGCSVSGAGDVNGDGYSDVVVGAMGYNNGEIFEGAAFIYHGSPTGISTTAAAMVQSDLSAAGLGSSVAGAGDVNGDGFSDVIAGAFQYANGQNNEGAAFVYHGSATGISTTAAAMIESNQVNGFMGNAVAGAGDVNGDGFSDVIAGIAYYDNGETDEGAAFIYWGNSAGTGKRNNLKLYNTDLTTPVNISNTSSATFGAGLFAKSFLGGQIKGKLVWETRLNYNAFSGIPITNSVQFTSSQSGYTNLGTAGTELKNQVAKLTGGRFVKIRARIKYDPVTAITGQLYSPWRYVPDVVSGLSIGILPVDLISFKAAWLEKGKTAQLKFITDNESDVSVYDVERSADGVSYSSIGMVAAKNTGRQTSYSYTDNNATGKKLYYRLKISFNTGTFEYSNIQMLQTDAGIEVLVFPNPAKDVIQFRLNNNYESMSAKIINSAGQTIKQLNNLSTAGQLISVPVNDLRTGIYFLYLQSGHEKQVLQFVKE